MAHEPTIDRTALYEGPAHIIFDKPETKADWKYCFCAGDVTLNVLRTAKEIPVAGFGSIDDPAADEIVEIDFEPAGACGAALFAWLFGILAKTPGQSIFASTDTKVWLHAIDGRLIEIKCAAVTAVPAIRFGAALSRFSGGAKITGVIGKSISRSSSTCLWEQLADEPFTAVPDDADWTHLPCLATWALTVPKTVVCDKDGWTLTARYTVTPRTNPDVGTFDFRVDTQAVEVSCAPYNLSDADLLSAALIGSDRRIGASAPSADLTLAEDYPGLTAVLSNARLTDKPIMYGEGKPRAGRLVWTARYGTSGLASIAPTSAPEA